MASIDEQIRANNAKIDANNAQIASLRASGNAWIKDGEDDNIRSLHKAADTAEKARKIKLGNDRLAEATVLESMNTSLLADNKALIKQREAEAQSMIILAQQGTTTAAVQTKATAEAESAKIIAESNAQAIATKAQTDATTSTTDSKTKMMVTVVIVVLLLAVLSVVAYKKIKKAKK